MTSRREQIMAAIESRLHAVYAGAIHRVGRANDDLPVTPDDLPVVILEMIRDVPQNRNMATARLLELSLVIYTSGANRIASADDLLSSLIPALLTPGDDLVGVRIHEGETEWTFDGSLESPILRTAATFSVEYRTDYNSI